MSQDPVTIVKMIIVAASKIMTHANDPTYAEELQTDALWLARRSIDLLEWMVTNSGLDAGGLISELAHGLHVSGQNPEDLIRTLTETRNG